MPTIAITLGDPAGIGPEVVDAALNSGKIPEGFEFMILGDRSAGKPGEPTKESAQSSLDALHQATDLLKAGAVDAVVTGPVCKGNLQQLGFNYPGQTEFFADALGVNDFGMLLTGSQLTVGLATIHEPLNKIATLLNSESIIKIGKLTADFLRSRKTNPPRIAVAGLNPHAGENGAFGNEESTIIQPAVDALNETGTAIFTGPLTPDAVFRDASLGQYDAVIAMYHDQGLIPLKLLDFDNAVNVTLGLPKPRTSPDHGTAFGIAGKNLADPSSMIAAICLACELAS